MKMMMASGLVILFILAKKAYINLSALHPSANFRQHWIDYSSSPFLQFSSLSLIFKPAKKSITAQRRLTQLGGDAFSVVVTTSLSESLESPIISKKKMQKWFIWRNYLHHPALLLVCINKITCCCTHIPFNQLNHHQTQPTANKLPDWSKKKARLHLNIIFWPVHLMCSAFCLCFFLLTHALCSI